MVMCAYHIAVNLPQTFKGTLTIPHVSISFLCGGKNLNMKKVTIEITEKGWTVSVHKDEKTFIEKHVATPTGAKSIEGNFEDEPEISEELYDALSGFANYDIMRALANEC